LYNRIERDKCMSKDRQKNKWIQGVVAGIKRRGTSGVCTGEKFGGPSCPKGRVAGIKRRGTSGVCTGEKFGGPSCPKGSKRYNLAVTFKKLSKR
jgi:hypothetical protein